MADVPHFDRPFRLSGTRFAVVEQDSDEELSNAAWAIASTEIGSRDEAPEFGVPDLAFLDPETVTSAVVSAVRRWEPRLDAEADATIEEYVMTVETRVE